MSTEFEVHLRVKPEEREVVKQMLLRQFGPKKKHPGYRITAGAQHNDILVLDVVTTRKADPVYEPAFKVVQLIFQEGIPGLVSMVFQVDSATLDELQRLGKTTPDYESIDLPDAERRLWLGQRSHSAWREGNLPRVHPEYGPNSALRCLRCHKKLAEERVVVWLTPTARFSGEWTEVGMHVECPT